MFFFSALPKHRKQAKQDRHKLFYNVQRDICKVNIIDGRFGKKDIKIKCRNCNSDIFYKKHEEKETDVALGIQVIHDLNNENLEKIIIISGDTDFLPVIHYTLYNTNVKIKVLVPMQHKDFYFSEYLKSENVTKNLKKEKQKKYSISPIKENHILKARLEDNLSLNGKSYKNPYI